MKHHSEIPLFVLYVGYLLIATFQPFVLSGNALEPATRFHTEFLTVKGLGTKDFAQNVLLFIPFGTLLYCCLKLPEKSGIVVVLMTVASGCVFSVSIELGQIFFARHPALSDVIANSFGALCGALLADLCPGWMSGVIGRSWNRLVSTKFFLFLFFMFGAVPLILSVVQFPWRTSKARVSIRRLNHQATSDRRRHRLGS
jgi:hypothetical protein